MVPETIRKFWSPVQFLNRKLTLSLLCYRGGLRSSKVVVVVVPTEATAAVAAGKVWRFSGCSGLPGALLYGQSPSICLGVKRDRASCKRSKHRENRTKEAAASASTPTASKHSGWCGRGASLPSSFFLVPLLFCKPYSSWQQSQRRPLSTCLTLKSAFLNHTKLRTLLGRWVRKQPRFLFSFFIFIKVASFETMVLFLRLIIDNLRRGFVSSFFCPRTILNCFVLNTLSSKAKQLRNFLGRFQSYE